jgi:CrcB protein
VTAPVLLGIGLIGGLGAIARFLLDGQVSARAGRDLPYGTFVVNIIGSLLLGVCAGAALGADAYRLAGTGFIGAFTTFSTWAFESHRLGEDGELRLASLNFGVSLVCGVLAAWAGRAIGMQL